VKLLIYGAGGVGGVLGAQLHRAGHEVTLVARGAHLDAIRSGGLTLETPSGRWLNDIPAVAHPSEAESPDAVILAMKSQDTPPAVTALSEAVPATTPVVCVQNGVANERAAARLFRWVYGVSVMCPTAFLDLGVVSAYSSPVTGILDIGRYPAGADDTAQRIATAFAGASFVSEPRDDIMRWKYRKLVMNLGNAVQALVGGVREGTLVKAAVAEGEQVLDAAGIDRVSLAADRARRAGLLDVSTVAGRARPGASTWQSLARGVGTIETDYLNGEIVLLGRLHDVPTPVNELLQMECRLAALRRDPPGSTNEDALLAKLG
jgi:2-dehydropantoate 2-reductase